MDYLRALDRVAGLVSAKRQDVIVAMVGESSSEAYLPEVHLEQELSVARAFLALCRGQGDRGRPVAGHDVPGVRDRAARR